MQISHSIFIKNSFFLCLFTLVFSASNIALASKGGELSDKTRIVTLKPSQLSAINGGKIASYSLASVRGGRMTAVPFQFDEITKSGYVYMKDLDKKEKEDDPLLGKEGFFDENDELIFMLKDAGPRRKNGMAADGKVISEIELQSYDKQPLYVYLIEEARLESESFYVRYSSKLGRVETDYYALQVSPENAFMWQEFYYDSFDGSHPRKPIDTIKIEMKGNALGGVPVTLTNKNIVAKAIAEKSGPIRATTQYKMTLTYLKTPLLNMKLQIVHHEHEIRYDAITNIPAVRRRMVGKPSLKMSLDGYDLQGAELRVKDGPKEPAIVDGEISAIEEQVLATPVEGGISNWLMLDSHYGFMLFSNYKIIADEPVAMNIVYEDNMNELDKNEYYKGQSPNAGFGIPFIPLNGDMRIIVDLKMYNEKLDIDANDFANIVNTEPAVKVSNL